MIQRPCFYVLTRSGYRDSANHLSYARDAKGSWRVYFISGGQMMSFAPEEIEEIYYSPAQAIHCEECNGPLENAGREGKEEK